VASGQHNGVVLCINDELSVVVHQSEDAIRFNAATIEVRLLLKVAGLRVFSDVRASLNVFDDRFKVLWSFTKQANQAEYFVSDLLLGIRRVLDL